MTNKANVNGKATVGLEALSVEQLREILLTTHDAQLAELAGDALHVKLGVEAPAKD